jgi:hypothetical protein
MMGGRIVEPVAQANQVNPETKRPKPLPKRSKKTSNESFKQTLIEEIKNNV